jgi:hypothetical protein
MAMTTTPLATTFVVNSRKAARASRGAPDSRVRPTTARGGTKEMAMATPGKVSEISDRTSATEPTAPVARAATRSAIWTVTRAATWPLVAATTG